MRAARRRTMGEEARKEREGEPGMGSLGGGAWLGGAEMLEQKWKGKRGLRRRGGEGVPRGLKGSGMNKMGLKSETQGERDGRRGSMNFRLSLRMNFRMNFRMNCRMNFRMNFA